ncbi:MAG TPA: sulfotransferase family protein [Acetobacteraceae bacterium]|jgi:hypothetical protein|nr:sulfotransferase family protein [Acetobacteraceae bacterium]
MSGNRVTKIVCILGMHRSGTSCLAGSLQEAGLHLGEVNTAAAHNMKGNRESRRIWELHDAVLEHSGGRWSEPPERVYWTDAHRAERDAIIRSYGDRPVWGFKDPRALLMLDFWREAIADIRFVGTVRHPWLVAESLVRREGRQLDYWLGIWAHYNERLLAQHDADPFPVLRFDIGEEVYRRSLAVVIDGLGLQAPAHMAFFHPELRHHAMPSEQPLPERLGRLYRSLCSIALDI